MACTYPASYATSDLTSSSFGVATRSASSGRRSSRSSSTSSRRSSSSRVSSRDCSPNPLDSQVRKSRATCTLSLTHVYVPGSSSSSSGATAAAMLSEGAVAAAALSDTRLPRVDDGDLHVDVMIEQIRVGGMENGVGAGVVGFEEVTTEEQAVPEFAAALKSSSSPSGKSHSVSSSSSSPRVGSAITEIKVNQIPFPTSNSTSSTSIVNATTATRPTAPSTASAAGLGAHILLRTSTLPPSSAMSTQRPSMFIRVAPLAIRTGTNAANKPADNTPPARRSRKSSVSLPGVPVATKARPSSRTGKATPIPIPRRKVAAALGDHILDEDSPKLRERDEERLAVTTVTATNARGESSSPPPYSPEPPSYEDAAAAVAAASAAVVRLQEEDKPTLHQPQPIRAKSLVDLSLLKPSLVAQLSKTQSKSKSASTSATPKSATSTSPPPRKAATASDVRVLLHLYRTITVGLEKRHRAYEAAKAAERLEEAARIAKKKLEGQWRFPIVEEDADGEDRVQGCDEKDIECVLNEDEEERILVPAAPPPTRNSSRSSTPTLVSPSPYQLDQDTPRHTAKFKPEMEVQDAILSIRLRNFLKANGVSERDLELRFSDDIDMDVCAAEEAVEEEEEDGGSVTYDLLQEEDEGENGDSAPAETPAPVVAAPLTTTPPPPSPPPKAPSPSQYIVPQTSMVALLTMRYRYATQRTRRPARVEERDSAGNKVMKSSGLGRVVAVDRGFEGVVVECVDEDAEDAAEKAEPQEEEEVVVVARG